MLISDILEKIFKNLGIENANEKFQANRIGNRLKKLCDDKVGRPPKSLLVKAIEAKCKQLKCKNSNLIFSDTFQILLEYNERESFYFDREAKRFVIFLPLNLKPSKGKPLGIREKNKQFDVICRGLGLLYSAVASLEIEYRGENNVLNEDLKECRNFLYNHLNAKAGKKSESFDKIANVITKFIPEILENNLVF